MKWNKTSEILPPENKYVLGYLNKKNRNDDDDPDAVYNVVVKFVKGISEEERDPSNNTYAFCDEGSGNNRRPYAWDNFGPATYFGQEIDYWMPLPTNPNNKESK